MAPDVDYALGTCTRRYSDACFQFPRLIRTFAWAVKGPLYGNQGNTTGFSLSGEEVMHRRVDVLRSGHQAARLAEV
jgi:hypothetical protein